jgi:hypothetical protein
MSNKKVVFALTRNGIKEKCDAENPAVCSRHVLHLGDTSNYSQDKIDEFEDANNANGTSYEEYSNYDYSAIVYYTVENTFSEEQFAEGVRKLSGVKAAIRKDYLNYTSVPFEGLYLVYGMNENDDEVALIKGEELITVETAKANAAKDYEENEKLDGIQGDFKNFATPKCMHCGLSDTMSLPVAAVDSYKAGALIQEAFPFFSAEKREQVKTGIHPECWIDIFGDDEDDEEGDL